jgi:hypothetical protein
MSGDTYYKLTADLSSTIREIDEQEDRRIETERSTIDDMYSTGAIIRMIDRCTPTYR